MKGVVTLLCICALIIPSLPVAWCRNYTVSVISTSSTPVLSYLADSSTYYQVFNPSWITATENQKLSGILARAQNCPAQPGKCLYCQGKGNPSVLLFSEQINPEPSPTFAPVSQESIAFAPDGIAEAYGTEDPRVALLPNGTYLLFYTQYGHDVSGNTLVNLALASTTDPTKNSNWVRFGPLFPSLSHSKSGALLVRDQPPHYLYWGDNSITLATSYDFLNWTNHKVFIAPREDSFDSQLVESGPPPMLLSTGDYIFFHNSADKNTSYHPEYVIINGTDPTQIVQRAQQPLLSPTMFNWAQGVAPELCNVPNVIFLEAAHPTDQPDVFRVYFGGADDVIGTALIKVTADS